MEEDDEEFFEFIVGNDETMWAAVAAAECNMFSGVERHDGSAVLRLLQNNGADVNCIIDRGEYTISTPLMDACKSGYTEIARILLDAGADARWKDRDGSSPLHKACRNGHLPIVEILINHDGGLLEFADKLGHTPLFAAIRAGRWEIVRLLMDRGANVRATDHHQTTALMLACQEGGGGDLDIVQRIVADGVDLEARDRGNRTALYYSVVGGNLDILRFLLDQGALVHGTSENNLTILMAASSYGRLEMTRLLLDSGADIEACDLRQRTALFYAASAGEIETVYEIILQHNANMFAVDSGGLT